MALQTNTTLKTYFNTGDQPTEAQFADLIDTSNKFITAEATSATIAVTDDTDYAVPAISQPAGTYLWEVSFISAGNIVTAGSSGNDLQFEIGTAASGGQIVALTDLLADGGAAVTMTATEPVTPIIGGAGRPDNYAVGAGVATSTGVTFAATGYSAAARDLHVNFRAKGADLATAATTIKVYMTFMVA
tara:strand:+ start:290 stop:853 length:564 start_codon:yes stop_codon:yes gene_type:complete